MGSIEPIQIDDEFKELINEPFMAKHLHIALQHTSKEMLKIMNAFNPDTVDELKAKVESELAGESPIKKEEAFKQLHEQLQNNAAKVFTGELNEYIENVRRAHEQKIDTVNPDEIIRIGWDKDNAAKAQALVADFKTWIEQHKNEITALQIFYAQAYRRRELTYKMIQEVIEKLKLDKPTLAPMQVWHAYEQLEKVTGKPLSELIALVSLIRRVCGIDKTLTSYDNTVAKNFRDWILKKNAGKHNRFNEEQMAFINMIKEQIVNSFHFEADDFELIEQGMLGRAYNAFGNELYQLIDELNEALAA